MSNEGYENDQELSESTPIEEPVVEVQSEPTIKSTPVETAMGKMVTGSIIPNTMFGSVYAEPVATSRVIGYVKHSQIIEILDDSDSIYYKVKLPNGVVGYCSRSIVIV